MRIETERLILRCFTEADLEDLFEYLSDAETVRFEPYRPMTREETKENLMWRIGTDEMIAVERRADGKLLGNIYLGHRDFDARELGYVFNRAFWGNGYAAEAAGAVIAGAFAEGTERIYAECDPMNPGSWRLLERLGFRREAHFRKNVYFWKDSEGNPIWKDTYVYALLKEEKQI